METYKKFLERKTQVGADHGFDPTWMPSTLFPFQVALVEWAVRKGRAAIFADCGLGKTPMQLTWAENVAQHTKGRVLILTPLAVAFQTVREGEKFGVEVAHRREGIERGDRIVVTNYERMHYFNPSDFAGVVLDESSILKAFTGKYRTTLTEAWKGKQFKLACTATPAPNDLMELGNHSEFLDVMRGCEMLSSYFINDPGHVGHYRIKGHAESLFWQWVASWAAYVRKPSDIGFDDGAFELPPLRLHEMVLHANEASEGMLFALEAHTLRERQAARRATIQARVERVAEIANKTSRPFLAWCDMNDESALLKASIPDAVEVKGADSEKHKEGSMSAFRDGNVRVLVSKPSIAGWGMNFQHCADMAFTGLSDSYEQYYQAVRRCWRFGQKRAVNCSIVTDATEGAVVANVKRKQDEVERMAEGMRAHMSKAMKIGNKNEVFAQKYTASSKLEVPQWLSA